VVHLWHEITPGNKKLNIVNVVIEIPMNSRCKYELDNKFGVIKLDRIIPSAVSYPANYGFIPQTLANDGDPLDVLLVSSSRFYPATLVKARPIGVMMMVDGGVKDEKIICVPIGDPDYKNDRSLKDLSTYKITVIEEFFRVYKNLEGKKVKVKGMRNAKTALKLIKKAVESYGVRFNK
tara:strand:- start:127 stop:660 length:534 start_codon:yes stop_codon:yes gene_type:complete